MRGIHICFGATALTLLTVASDARAIPLPDIGTCGSSVVCLFIGNTSSGGAIETHAVSGNGIATYTGGNSSALYAEASNTGGSGYGIIGASKGSGPAIQGTALGTGNAGQFAGHVVINGNLSASGTKAFLIDHPLDRANKVLRHVALESPEAKNVYDGITTMDKNGEAWVLLPSYFEALNRDFRYQLTNVGSYAKTYIASEIRGNRFKIAGGKPGMKVSWQVTGIRHDASLEDHPVVVEEDKPPSQRGKYLYARKGEQPMGPGNLPNEKTRYVLTP